MHIDRNLAAPATSYPVTFRAGASLEPVTGARDGLGAREQTGPQR